MTDKEIEASLLEITHWLDSLIFEVNKINETLEDLLAEVPNVVGK